MALSSIFHQEHRKIAHAQAALQCCHQVGILRQSSSQYNHKIYSILAAHPWFTCLSFILALQLHRQGQPNQFLRGKSLWALPPRPPPCLARLATFLPGEAPSLWARCPAPACSPPASHLRSPQPVVSWNIYVYCPYICQLSYIRATLEGQFNSTYFVSWEIFVSPLLVTGGKEITLSPPESVKQGYTVLGRRWIAFLKLRLLITCQESKRWR